MMNEVSDVQPKNGIEPMYDKLGPMTQYKRLVASSKA